MRKRTRNQIKADSVDRQLYVLLDKARYLSGKDETPNPDPRWAHVATLLMVARRPLREMMHPEDEKLTR